MPRCLKVGHTLDQGNTNFTFPQVPASTATQIRYTESGFTQNQLPNCQNRIQNSGNSYGMNQQGTYGQNHPFGQPMQQDQFFYNNQQQQQQKPCGQNLQSVSGNPCLCPPGIGQPNSVPCGNYLPQNIIDQIRTCVGNTTPIFILPNSQPIQAQPFSQIGQNPANQVPPNIGYPSPLGIGYPGLGPNSIFSSPACYPIPVPILSFCNPPIGNYQNQRSQFERNSNVCDCCRRNNNGGHNSGQIRNPGTLQPSNYSEENETHRCCPGNDDTVCTKPNCPVSINLQALASQLLSLQGIIPCAATRLVLRKVPGSNVTTTVEETVDRAQKSIGSLNKEQLITEARNAQQVNGLINLHMMANPPQNIIPILTMLQLKVNSLKSLVENLVNKSISECQSIGTNGNQSLEPLALTMKSDADIRELLATLRQKECEERVNVNYAPYHSQRVVAESRLANFQNKIHQVEAEIERRRAAAMPWNCSTGQLHHQTSFPAGKFCIPNTQESYSNGTQGFYSSQSNDASSKGFDSPSPFMVQVQSPRRLNLKPNVGGPQTTYDRSLEERVPVSAVNESKEFSSDKKSCPDDGAGTELSREASDSSKGSTESKKKLQIHIDGEGELSVKKKSLEEMKGGERVQVSSEVVFVIDDKETGGSKAGEKNVNKKLKEKKIKMKGNEKKSVKKKSTESIPSDSTYDSETSVSSRSSDGEDKELERRIEKEERKSGLKTILKGRRKNSSNEEAAVTEPGDKVES